MEHHNRILQQIAVIQLLPFFDHIRVLPHHEPSDVGKEKTPLRVVRVRVGFRVFVMHSVVLHPL